MFPWSKKKSAPPADETSIQMRDLLFGDLPLERWTGDGTNPPWSDFVRAGQFLQRDEKTSAIAIFEKIAAQSDLEARHTLQAWNFLRDLGVQPPDAIAKQVLGVVVEVGLDEGLDVLAAYPDHQARYWNWSGAGVVWERPDERLDPAIDELLAASEQVVQVIGPWEGARPAPVTRDKARINFLTPSGLHFGEAPFSALSRDPLAAPVINAATRLMQQMTQLATS